MGLIKDTFFSWAAHKAYEQGFEDGKAARPRRMQFGEDFCQPKTHAAYEKGYSEGLALYSRMKIGLND